MEHGAHAVLQGRDLCINCKQGRSSSLQPGEWDTSVGGFGF